MCTILFSYKTTPGYRLILAANRDEFLHRDTAPLAYLDDRKEVLAGRDFQGGGTWLGLNSKGNIGAITNFREPQIVDHESPSRGEILVQYLTANVTSAGFLSKLEEKANEYRGFNLLLGDKNAMYYYSNRSKGMLKLRPGIYGLSNHFLDSDWPKVRRGKVLLNKVLSQTTFNTDNLFSMLCDTHQPSKEQLPDTGVDEIWERLLASIFITSTSYGTRSSAVITVKENGYTEFRERTYLHGADGWQTGHEKCYTITPINGK